MTGKIWVSVLLLAVYINIPRPVQAEPPVQATPIEANKNTNLQGTISINRQSIKATDVESHYYGLIDITDYLFKNADQADSQVAGHILDFDITLKSQPVKIVIFDDSTKIELVGSPEPNPMQAALNDLQSVWNAQVSCSECDDCTNCQNGQEFYHQEVLPQTGNKIHSVFGSLMNCTVGAGDHHCQTTRPLFIAEKYYTTHDPLGFFATPPEALEKDNFFKRYDLMFDNLCEGSILGGTSRTAEQVPVDCGTRAFKVEITTADGQKQTALLTAKNSFFWKSAQSDSHWGGDTTTGKITSVLSSGDPSTQDYITGHCLCAEEQLTDCSVAGICADGNDCTVDACSPVIGCIHTLDPKSGCCAQNSDCDDGQFCNGVESCNLATKTCVSGTASTNPSCCNSNSDCETGDTNKCDGVNQCISNVCQPPIFGSPVPNCDDGNACTDDVCAPTTGLCSHPANTNSCNDGNVCTSNDKCQAGSCEGGFTISCDDGNPCTNDSCSDTSGCRNVDNTATCADANLCNGNEVCSAGKCQAGTPMVCEAPPNTQCFSPKGNCFAGACNYVVVGIGQACNDDKLCTSDDTCTESGACAGTAKPMPMEAPGECEIWSHCDANTGAWVKTKDPSCQCLADKDCIGEKACMVGSCAGDHQCQYDSSACFSCDDNSDPLKQITLVGAEALPAQACILPLPNADGTPGVGPKVLNCPGELQWCTSCGAGAFMCLFHPNYLYRFDTKTKLATLLNPNNALKIIEAGACLSPDYVVVQADGKLQYVSLEGVLAPVLPSDGMPEEVLALMSKINSTAVQWTTEGLPSLYVATENQVHKIFFKKIGDQFQVSGTKKLWDVSASNYEKITELSVAGNQLSLVLTNKTTGKIVAVQIPTDANETPGWVPEELSSIPNSLSIAEICPEDFVLPGDDTCDGVDDDQDGLIDEDALLVQPADENQNGVCFEAVKLCLGSVGEKNIYEISDCSSIPENIPDFKKYRAQCEALKKIYQPIETNCDGKDNDCDGAVDEDCECITGQTQECDTDLADYCAPGTQACVNGHWSAECEGSTERNPEECNGFDDDCDGFIDDGVCHKEKCDTQTCGCCPSCGPSVPSITIEFPVFPLPIQPTPPIVNEEPRVEPVGQEPEPPPVIDSGRNMTGNSLFGIGSCSLRLN